MSLDWRAAIKKDHPRLASLPPTLHVVHFLSLHGLYVEAIAALRECIEEHPDDLQAYQQLERLLKRIARFEEANQVSKKAALIEALKYSNDLEELAEVADFINSSANNDQACSTAPASYIASLFDQGASIFEPLLRNSLQYRAPELLLAACQRTSLIQSNRLNILDLGCGTGLIGEVFKPYAARLEGIDLSKGMLKLAQEKQLYDELHVSDISDYLKKKRSHYSLILAADVFVYIGDLETVFSDVKNALVQNGHFAFTVEKSKETDYFLQAVRRYAHSKNYLERLAVAHNFSISIFEETSTRLESSRPVPSYLLVLRSE
jgi:predicted TPR repeat methyltransferase